jgi:hypothetical protein
MMATIEAITDDQSFHPRDDGFFDPDITDRSQADEIYEALMNSVVTGHEERKARYFGYLLKSISERTDIGLADANSLVSLSGTLTYRQLCLAYIFTNRDDFSLREHAYEPDEMSVSLSSVFQIYVT